MTEEVAGSTFNKKSTRTADWGPRGTAAATIAARLSFENLTRKFGYNYAIKDVSLDISPGEIVCLLGPSGCGKTTLLRLAAGIERPTSGRVLINNSEVSGPDRFVLPEKRNVGLMFQDFALFPHLTILDNVAFGLKALGRTEAQREARAALQRVGLAHYASEYPHILSGGEQQRVALARAIAPRPSVLLMDEPFSGLDNRLRASMREETLTILRETRATCVIVTHQSEEAMRMGDRIAVMRDGEIAQVGSAKDLYHNPNNMFVARIFSDMNEISYPVKKGEIDTPFGVYHANGIADGDLAMLCIRHRAIRLVDPGKGRIGRILDTKFLGDAALLQIAVDGLDSTILARVRESEAPGPGAEVGVDIDSSLVLIFDQQSNNVFSA